MQRWNKILSSVSGWRVGQWPVSTVTDSRLTQNAGGQIRDVPWYQGAEMVCVSDLHNSAFSGLFRSERWKLRLLWTIGSRQSSGLISIVYVCKVTKLLFSSMTVWVWWVLELFCCYYKRWPKQCYPFLENTHHVQYFLPKHSDSNVWDSVLLHSNIMLETIWCAWALGRAPCLAQSASLKNERSTTMTKLNDGPALRLRHGNSNGQDAALVAAVGTISN